MPTSETARRGPQAVPSGLMHTAPPVTPETSPKAAWQVIGDFWKPVSASPLTVMP